MTRPDDFTKHDNAKVSTARKVAYLAIGAVAYLGFHGVFLSMISFLNGGPLPWSSYEAPDRSLAIALAINAGLVALFGIQHAIMARASFKRRWTRIVPEPIERSVFVIATIVCLGSALAFWQPIAGSLYSIESPALRIAVYALQALGWGVVVWSTFLIDHFELFGLRQVWYTVVGKELPAQRFRMPALYRYSRHPMMVGMLMGFWAAPDMTLDRLVFALGFSLYIWVGVLLEENELAQNLGDEYRVYQTRVARFLPLPGTQRRLAKAAATATLFVAIATAFFTPRTAAAQMLNLPISRLGSAVAAGSTDRPPSQPRGEWRRGCAHQDASTSDPS